MKGKKFYAFLVVLLIIGLSSVYFFRQKQAEKYLEFEAYEIENIEKKIARLYNKEKTDLSEELSIEQFQSIQESLEELKTKEYSPKNQKRLEKVEGEYLEAKAMEKLQVDVETLFTEEGIIEKNLTLTKINPLEERLQKFREKVVYYDRNQRSLADAKEQVNTIETAKSFMNSLFENEFVRADVTRESEEEALELIGKIKNKEVREELLTRAEKIDVALTEAEEALALEEALAEEAAAQQELEELEEQEQTSEQEDWQPSQSNSWNRSESTGNSGNTNTGNTNTWRPPSHSSGGGTTSQESNQPSNQENEETTDEVENEESDSTPEETETEEPPIEQEENTNEES